MDRKSRKRFSREFKLEAIKRSNESGKTVSEVARELDLSVYQLHRWRKQAEEQEENVFKESRYSHQKLSDENKRLKAEVEILKEERDILKKSLIFFAKDHPRNLDSSKNMRGSSE